ncbi:MAG: hypothetical protein WCB68_15020 [Pyrinomonadaceae bacterium]
MIYKNLDTAYVNLAALLRYLQQRGFNGRVHVLLDEYDADVQLKAGSDPLVREKDHTTGRLADGEAALQRLLVRAREAGGLISVYEDVSDEQASEAASELQVAARADEAHAHESPSEESEWNKLLKASGDLIGAVERAALGAGADFEKIFRAARFELADDYPFLDPSSTLFHYANGVAELQKMQNMKMFVAGMTECLRRVVNLAASGPRGRSARERVALALAVLARRQHSKLEHFGFSQQLERIAGTKVL